MIALIFFALYYFLNSINADLSLVPKILSVSAMCSADGITACIEFDQPFNGKIYSMDYSMIHECVYFNTLGLESVLFTIPIHKCGTKISKNTRNVVDLIENHIYVQMEKDMQTSYDRQYSFMCQLVPVATGESSSIDSESFKQVGKEIENNNWENWPINPSIPSSSEKFVEEKLRNASDARIEIIDWKEKNGLSADSDKTFNEKTTGVTRKYLHAFTANVLNSEGENSFDPIKIVAKQSSAPKKSLGDIYLEIQYGDGPYGNTVTGPIAIGDNISLVIKAKTFSSKNDEFDVFVHSCFATDGPGKTKIMLTDEIGCVVKQELASSMRRLKKGNEIYYFLRLKAFKFPGPNDVYFSCTIDKLPYQNTTICPQRTNIRDRRAIVKQQLHLYDSIQVDIHKRIGDIMDGFAGCLSGINLFSAIVINILLFIIATISTSINCVLLCRKIKL